MNNLFNSGLENRKRVLGKEHVERSLDAASKFTQESQELVTEFCWGAIWGRPGLKPRDRSLINLAMLTALNRNHEFQVHVRGAVNNGLTEDEIKEVLLQTMVYCGAPAALESFRAAEEVLNDLKKNSTAAAHND